MEFMTEPIPTWALCYLINGDSTGLTENDITMIDKWYADNKVQSVTTASEDEGIPTHISLISRLSDLLLRLWIAS